ncbi:hypothetical protein AVEN_254609-1, partial [Araneus ventricosus]
MQKRGGKGDEVFVDADEGKIHTKLEPEVKWWEKSVKQLRYRARVREFLKQSWSIGNKMGGEC